MNSEELTWFILKCGVTFGVICLLFLFLVGALKAISYVSEQGNLSNHLKIECLGKGGIVEDKGYSMYPGDVTCIGYDDDDFRYYWHKDENGGWYKTR